MSVLSLKADIRQREWDVRYVPRADIRSAVKDALTNMLGLRTFLSPREDE